VIFRLVVSLLALTPFSPHAPKVRIGAIEFFGTLGIGVPKVRAVLPVREGEDMSEDQVTGIRDQISQAIKGAVGHPPTDISLICCNDRQELTIYIGLGGSNSARISLHSAPKDSTCLPQEALALYNQAMDAVEQAVKRGNAGEDDSRGYALSSDRTLRAKQLAMHAFALSHQPTLERALQTCGKPEHRRVAAEILSYGKESEAQLSDLVRASRDPDELVRNNAVRALWVLAESSPKIASEIPANRFIEMLNSGVWQDRNKAGLLLLALTRSRPPQLLQRLRADALPSLIEMARWKDSGHAYPYQVMLGRIAGFDPAIIEHLIQSGEVSEMIAAAESHH